MKLKQFIPNEKGMLDLGAKIAHDCLPGSIIFLQGELGAGKTTLVRGFLRALGYQGVVRSPTYTLVESYQIKDLQIHHFDFYRLRQPEELEYMGLRDYLTKDAIALIEWPENAGGLLPKPTLSCKIDVPDDAVGRWVSMLKA